MRKFLEVQMSFKVTCVRSRFFLAGFAPSDSAIVTKRRRKFADLPVFHDCLYLGKLVFPPKIAHFHHNLMVETLRANQARSSIPLDLLTSSIWMIPTRYLLRCYYLYSLFILY